MVRNRNHPRYGVILLPYSVSFERLLEAAQRAENLGFDSLWISDHMQRDSIPTHECWTTISAVSAVTKSISVGSLATCNSFRNPALLAKMVATISQISQGRTDLAIGIGYDKIEHEAYGYQFHQFKDRVERLSETIEILRLLWTNEKSDFNGKHWKLKGAVCKPKPAGHTPKIWVAGRNPLILKAAADGHAHGVNILPYSGVLDKRHISSFEELELITRQIDDFNLSKSLYCGDGGLVIGQNENDYESKLHKLAEIQKISSSTIRQRIENLSILHGSVKECAAQLRKLELLGFEELMIIFNGWQSGDYSNMDLFAKEFIKN